MNAKPDNENIQNLIEDAFKINDYEEEKNEEDSPLQVQEDLPELEKKLIDSRNELKPKSEIIYCKQKLNPQEQIFSLTNMKFFSKTKLGKVSYKKSELAFPSTSNDKNKKKRICDKVFNIERECRYKENYEKILAAMEKQYLKPNSDLFNIQEKELEKEKYFKTNGIRSYHIPKLRRYNKSMESTPMKNYSDRYYSSVKSANKNFTYRHNESEEEINGLCEKENVKIKKIIIKNKILSKTGFMPKVSYIASHPPITMQSNYQESFKTLGENYNPYLYSDMSKRNLTKRNYHGSLFKH